jgi:hypothetical protein
VAVGPDILEAISVTLPGKKKAKVSTPPSPHPTQVYNSTQRNYGQTLDSTFREVLMAMAPDGHSTEDTGEDSDE